MILLQRYKEKGGKFLEQTSIGLFILGLVDKARAARGGQLGAVGHGLPATLPARAAHAPAPPPRAQTRR